MSHRTGQKAAVDHSTTPPVELVESLIEEFKPSNPHEQALVEDLAHARWFLWCGQRLCYAVESEIYQLRGVPSRWLTDDLKRLVLASRYRNQAERSFECALRNVESFGKERMKTLRWETMYDLAVRRLDLEKKKYELSASQEDATVEKIRTA